MGGLFVMFLAFAYLLIAIVVISKIKNWRRRLAAVLLFILIPTADAVYGRIRLRAMCEAEGGLKVNRVVHDVQGFFAPQAGYELWLSKYRYRYVETRRGSDLIRKSRSDDSQTLSVEKISAVRSPFEYDVSEGDSGTYLKQQQVVKDLRTKEILGTDTDIAYYGGWVERLIGGISDSGRIQVDHCNVGYPEERMVALVTSVLEPSNSNIGN